MNFGDDYIEVNPYKYDAEMPKEPPKYRIIDILNKIANGELKEGTRIKTIEDTYEYDDGDLMSLDGAYSLFDFVDVNALNEEVELIEPIVEADKTVEPTDNTKIEELDAYELDLLKIFYKLNEVIRYINK